MSRVMAYKRLSWATAQLFKKKKHLWPLPANFKIKMLQRGAF